MSYSRFIGIIFTLLISSTVSYAENWVPLAPTDAKEIYLDADSIIWHKGKLFYNVRYYDKNAKEDLVVGISADTKRGGILYVAKWSDYIEDRDKYYPNILSAPRVENAINPKSNLYNINILAQKYHKDSLEQLETVYNTADQNSENNVKEPDFGPYMRDLQRKIKRNWEPPKGNESKRVVVLFKVSKDGRLLSSKILKSSGNERSDDAALKAVKLTAPFGPLPAGFNGNIVDIQFTFDYNVYGASRH